MDFNDSLWQYNEPFDSLQPAALDATTSTFPWIDFPTLSFDAAAIPSVPTVGAICANVELQEQDRLSGGTGWPVTKSRKPKAPTLRDSDWEPYKDRILDLYSHQKLNLQSVQRIIKEEKGFHAELRQYETILKKWKQGKYIKHREMEAIVRKTQQRNLVDVDRGALAFKVREKPIETERIQRWMRTRGIPDDELYDPNSPEPTPSDVECRTISDRETPPFPHSAFSTPTLGSPLHTQHIAFPHSMSYSGSHDNTSGVGSYSRESPRVSAVSIPWLQHGTVDDADIDVIMDSVEPTDNYEPLDVASPLLSFPGASPSSSGEDNDDLSNFITQFSRHFSDVQSAIQDFERSCFSYETSRRRLAYIGHTLESTSRLLSVLGRFQEIFYNLEKQDNISALSRLNITQLLRQSRVTQYHLQSLEIASLNNMRALKSADESQPRKCNHSVCMLKHFWRKHALNHRLPVPPEWAGALCDHPCCSWLA